MPKKSILTQLREQAQKGKLAEDVAIAFRLQGDSGESQIDEAIDLTSPGGLHIKVNDRLASKPQGEASTQLANKDLLDTFNTVLAGIDDMVPAGKARFIPDTLLGSVTLAMGGQTETYYFEADEEDLEHRGQPLSAPLKALLAHMTQMENRHLSNGKGRALR